MHLSATLDETISEALASMSDAYSYASHYTTPPNDKPYWNLFPLLCGDGVQFDRMLAEEEQLVRSVSQKLAQVNGGSGNVRRSLETLDSIAKSLGVEHSYAEFREAEMQQPEEFVRNGMRFASELWHKSEIAKRSLEALKRQAKKTENESLELEAGRAAGRMETLKLATEEVTSVLESRLS